MYYTMYHIMYKHAPSRLHSKQTFTIKPKTNVADGPWHCHS